MSELAICTFCITATKCSWRFLMAQLQLNLQLMSNHQDIIIIAVCVSIGGVGLLAGLAYMIVKHRRRTRGLARGQDILPRPFDALASAPTHPLAVPLPRLDAHAPVLDISRNNATVDRPPRSSQDTGRSGQARGVPIPRAEVSDRPRAHSRPSEPTRRPGNRQGSEQSHRLSHVRTRTRDQDEIRRYASEHPSGSFPRSFTTPSHLLDRETRIVKSALRLSRSANDLDRAAGRSHARGTTQQYTVPLSPPSNNQHGAHQIPRGSDHTRTPLVNESTRHIRPYHSASPVVRPGRSAGRPRIQHRDAGPIPVSDLPPPYAAP
ncbi:hypothetical protein V8B97DRAFT_1156707 [Scleroderma yunnanense]